MCENPFWLKNERFWAPCGKCPYCLGQKRRSWQIRCMNEYNFHKGKTSFLTLTYNQPSLPFDGSLFYPDVQNFIKSLRYYFCGTSFKYFLCGEYGKKHLRPHYHLVIFGIPYSDLEVALCEKKLWNFGFYKLGYSFNSSVAAYVAGYTVKKLFDAPYPPGTVKPFLRVSQGLGKRYAIDHAQTILEDGFIRLQKQKYAIPRYYFKIFGIDRRDYYNSKVDDYLEDLIAGAMERGLAVFNFSMDYVDRKEADHLGLWVQHRGLWRIITKDFRNYIWSVRHLINLKIKTRYAKQLLKRVL